MGGNPSKRKTRHSLASLERNASRKKYLPDNNETASNGHEGAPSLEDRAAPELPQFTQRQRELVVMTWKVVQRDISNVGVSMFLKLFETHPEVQGVFAPFRGQSPESLKDSVRLKSHALRVLGTVDTCLLHVHDVASLHAMLHELGDRHLMYNAKVDYIDLIGPHFIWAMEPVLGESWTPEVEQAWSDLFKVISHIMKGAMTL